MQMLTANSDKLPKSSSEPVVSQQHTRKKQSAEEYFNQNNFQLHHFTDESNMRTIRKHGLLSYKQLKKRKIKCTTGGNDLSHYLDKEAGKQNYVRLCVTYNNKPYHPMEYVCRHEQRINKTQWLKIDNSILSIPGVEFSDRNAAKSDAVIKPTHTHLRFDVLRDTYGNHDGELKEFIQAEVLVPINVPLS